MCLYYLVLSKGRRKSKVYQVVNLPFVDCLNLKNRSLATLFVV